MTVSREAVHALIGAGANQEDTDAMVQDAIDIDALGRLDGGFVEPGVNKAALNVGMPLEEFETVMDGNSLPSA
ncbi:MULTISPECIES: hypothetical protein [unclassified Streptomyces]|uniref:hypothetical protein n=1 Tax=unclassified Streptomyces TaxID=2593676 RepID=UPI00341C6146